jgi:hypothetical protein
VKTKNRVVKDIQKGNRELLQKNVRLETRIRELNDELMSTYRSRDFKTDDLDDSAHGGNGTRNALASTTYNGFAATHPPLFTEAGEPLEADHWLWVMESKFEVLRYTKVQKTFFAAQQLRGDVSVWWANYTATRPVDYQVSWAEIRNAFCTHYIPAGMMRKKRQEFMELK